MSNGDGDSAKIFSYILCKEQCSINESNHEIKCLDLFIGGESGRTIEDCIIIDNSIFSFQRHLSNGILVPKYEGQTEDKILEKLTEYLMSRFGSGC